MDGSREEPALPPCYLARMHRAILRTSLLLSLTLVPLSGTRAQELPPGVPADTLRLPAEAGFLAGATGRPIALEAGERIVSWAIEGVAVERPEVGGRFVPDARLGDVVARFAGSAPFAWPIEPTVWAASRAGSLAFGLHARSLHEPRGVGRIVIVRLGHEGSAIQAAFEPPVLALDRVPAGVRVRYADRAGFGLDRGTLALTVRTARGVVYSMKAWAPVGADSTLLPLPPPGIELPPGTHVLEATISDRLGNASRVASFVFDS